MFRFSTPVAPRLSIEVPAGDVTVDTASVDDTTVELLALDDSEVTRDAIAATLVEQRGDIVAVHVPERFGRLGRSPRIAVRVVAPDEPGLVVRTGSAGVTATGRFGTTRVDSGSGRIDIAVVVDSARVNTGSGDVRVERVEGDASVRTGSGDVSIGTVGGKASFTSGSGSLELGSGGRAVVAKSASGDVTIGTAPADVRLTTASGDISIATVDEGDVRAKAASGDIRAAVRRGTAAWLDVHTVTGRVRSGLEAGGEPEADQRRVRLQLTTVSGDIDLERV